MVQWLQIYAAVLAAVVDNGVNSYWEVIEQWQLRDLEGCDKIALWLLNDREAIVLIQIYKTRVIGKFLAKF